MDKACIDSLLAQGPPPIPGRVAWAPTATSLSARCPVCGALCDAIYLDRDDLTVGCNRCVVAVYVHDYAVGLAEKGGDVQ